MEDSLSILLPCSECVLEISSDGAEVDLLCARSRTNQGLLMWIVNLFVHLDHHAGYTVFEEACVRKDELTAFDQVRFLLYWHQVLHQPLERFWKTSKSFIFLVSSIYLVDLLQFLWDVLQPSLDLL